MIGRRISIGLAILAVSGVVSFAQTPVLSNIEAPYAAVQGSVQIAGHSYGPGAVAYGPAGTPLVLTGSDLGTTGTVTFIAYKNGAVSTNVQPTVATPTMWTSTMIFLPVPIGAYSGMIQVTMEGKNSNLLPFIVTPGAYAGFCPAGPTTTQLQITTASLHDGAVGQSYSAALSATGGTQSYTWSVASGTVPAGLSLNASTGTISGTPTTAVSPASVTFEVTDSGSPRQANQALLEMTIEPPQMTAGTVYSYSAMYDGLGNVTQYQDTVMGTWNFTYDALNRLQSGSAVGGGSGSQDFTGQNLCWAYDSYGNRTTQVMQTSACPSQESSLTPTVNYSASNQIADGGLHGYDPAGNLNADNTTGNSYLYDGEGRICAAKNEPVPGTWIITGYLYDAEGARIAKGTLSNCASLAGCTCDPTQNGFQITQNYVLGPSGEELSMLDGNNNWQRTNVFAAGKLIGTYDAAGLHFHLEDPLGTRRMQLSGNPNSVGQPETDIQSLPYGDGFFSFPDQYAPPSADDATPLHFTQHEHDTESGNDYFGARYYASSIGRFLSPDWSAKEEPVPYAKLDDPQTLNLYSFVGNNPLARADADGHCFPLCLAVAGGGALLADEAPLAATGPSGWTVIGATALGVGGYALYEHYHQDTPAPPATPAPTTSAAGQSTPASPQEPNRKDGGSKTEPNLPKKTVANEDGVEIKHFTRSGDHGPAHLHVEGGGESTKIGMNGKPLSGSPELSSTQQSVVNNNLSTIRSAVDKIQRWFGFNSK